MKNVVKGYEELERVLQMAYDQASKGKGKERHADSEPFHKQAIMQISKDVGIGFPLGQAIKKLRESARCYKDTPQRAIADILGAINYAAAAVLLIEAECDLEAMASEPAAAASQQAMPWAPFWTVKLKDEGSGS